jgi:formylglycine-generating enzyme required for sulfatase activity
VISNSVHSFFSWSRTLTLAAVFGAALSTPAAAVLIDTVAVRNAGNASDTTGYGAVAYNYRMGTYEVTNDQYAEFLNAKAASDPRSLYDTFMASQPLGGIVRSGSSGSYSYSVKPDMGNKPVIYVRWSSAVQFVNWLHNGQGTGDTLTGAYTLAQPNPATRNVGATWVLPTENEWYKAAYYDPTLAGGSGGYWNYATRNNFDPIVATADGVGDISNPGANVSNYLSGADWNGQDGNLTTVGSAGALSDSFYGTFDQSGNASEWTETLSNGLIRSRILRGGAWGSEAIDLSRDYGQGVPESLPGLIFTGFRVAYITVPEPSSLLLAVLGCGLLCWRRVCSRSVERA